MTRVDVTTILLVHLVPGARGGLLRQSSRSTLLARCAGRKGVVEAVHAKSPMPKAGVPASGAGYAERACEREKGALDVAELWRASRAWATHSISMLELPCCAVCWQKGRHGGMGCGEAAATQRRPADDAGHAKRACGQEGGVIVSRSLCLHKVTCFAVCRRQWRYRGGGWGRGWRSEASPRWWLMTRCACPPLRGTACCRAGKGFDCLDIRDHGAGGDGVGGAAWGAAHALASKCGVVVQAGMAWRRRARWRGSRQTAAARRRRRAR